MRSHKKIDLKLDISEIKQTLVNHPEYFGKYNYRATDGSPHHEMTDIWIRFNDIDPFIEKGDLSKIMDEHDSIWYDIADSLPVKSLIFSVMSKVQGERLGGVLITKLPPGGKIYPHTDSGWHPKYYDKYYIPIQNKPGSTFNFDDGVIRPDEGDVYWFDNSVTHWVNNDTDIDRIGMVVCVKTANRLGV